MRHGLGSPGCTPVAVARHLITAYALLDEHLSNHFCGEMLGFAAVEHPSRDVPAVDVEDEVEVVVVPLCRTQQLRDVPCPDLIGGSSHQLRLGMRRMPELVAAIADSHLGLEDALHRVDGAGIGAIVQQFCVPFGRSLIGERSRRGGHPAPGSARRHSKPRAMQDAALESPRSWAVDGGRPRLRPRRLLRTRRPSRRRARVPRPLSWLAHVIVGR